MTLLTLSEWLRCPICLRDLVPRPPLAVACSEGHAFDVNKRGFVTLAPGGSRLQHDTPAMLDARDAFLATGAYAPLRDAVATAVAERSAGRFPARILDVGCGTGYYLDAALSACPDARALAMDLSPAAVARTVRRSERIDGVVANVWAPLPFRDASADVILNVFAPRNPAEFHRVLAPGGTLAVVIPGDDHLRELRHAGLLIDVQPGKADQLLQSLGDGFVPDGARDIRSRLRLDRAGIEALIGMGPSAHHATAASAVPDQLDVGTSFRLLLFALRDVPRA